MGQKRSKSWWRNTWMVPYQRAMLIAAATYVWVIVDKLLSLLVSWLYYGHLKDHPFLTLAFFFKFLTSSPSLQHFFTTIRRQIRQTSDPSPPKNCQRLKWMVPKVINTRHSQSIFSCMCNEKVSVIFYQNLFIHPYIFSL